MRTLVLTKDTNVTAVISDILVQFYTIEGGEISEVKTNDKGNFSFSGLKKGKYIVSIDKEQLKILGYQSIAVIQNVVIKVSEDGDIIKGVDFVLTNSKN